MKKALISTALALCLLCSSTSAFATTVTKNSSGQSFTDSWELSASGTNWLMNYGYNEDWINEDYTHTTHSVYDHIATVSNSNGAYSDEASSKDW